MTAVKHFEVVVVGSGPAGQNGAIEAARNGRRVLVIEQQPVTGGACVEFGTVPSKTLRETAIALSCFRRKSGDCFQVEAREDLKLRSLMRRLAGVVSGYQRSIGETFGHFGVEVLRGKARLLDARQLEVTTAGNRRERIGADVILLAVGSRPRVPDGIPIDHEWILDSDSILALSYLPHSLTVLGAGVIACEYASIFAALGVQVTLTDASVRPLAFLDPELSSHFQASFETTGARFLGGRKCVHAAADGVASTHVTLDDGTELTAERTFVALGRVANVEGLGLEAAGLQTTPRGQLAVDGDLRTAQPHIYAAGDVIGPPALAASSMDQGRRAIRHALGLPLGSPVERIPTGVYTIPEISCVGLTEEEARRRHGDVRVGRAHLAELARGEIAALDGGMLKLVADAQGRLLGAHIVGEGAAELIHVAQMALAAEARVELFIETIFNFPTLAEAYRVAALEIEGQLRGVRPVLTADLAV